MSSRIRSGQGSREVSGVPMEGKVFAFCVGGGLKKTQSRPKLGNRFSFALVNGRFRVRPDNYFNINYKSALFFNFHLVPNFIESSNSYPVILFTFLNLTFNVYYVFSKLCYYMFLCLGLNL